MSRPRPRVVGIAAKPTGAPARRALKETLAVLERRRVETLLDHESAALARRSGGMERAAVTRAADVMVVIGGDGTFLSVARSVTRKGPALVGINLGSLGFLTEVHRREIEPALQRVLDGEAGVERRMMLAVAVGRDGGRRQAYTALNDVVLTKSALARTVRLQVEVDGEPVTSYRGDGLILASPTGSSAYSLSAGGALVHPALEAILITPVCPHTLSNRPLLIPSASRIVVKRLSREEEVYLTVDGQVGGPFQHADRIEVRRSPVPLRILRPFSRSFYATLRSKLKWR